MFTIIHTSFRESKDRMALALRFENPLTQVRYTVSLGLARDARSNLDDPDAYSRRVDDYRRSIELSGNS